MLAIFCLPFQPTLSEWLITRAKEEEGSIRELVPSDHCPLSTCGWLRRKSHFLSSEWSFVTSTSGLRAWCPPSLWSFPSHIFLLPSPQVCNCVNCDLLSLQSIHPYCTVNGQCMDDCVPFLIFGMFGRNPFLAFNSLLFRFLHGTCDVLILVSLQLFPI